MRREPRARWPSASASTRARSRWAGRCTAPSPAMGRATEPGQRRLASPGAELPQVDGHLTDAPGPRRCWCWSPTACRWRSPRRPRGDAALRLARAGRRDRRERARALRRAARGRRRRARASARAATRSATEVLEAFADVDGRRRRPHARPARGRRGAAARGRRRARRARGPVHSLPPRPVLLPPPRRRRHRPPGGIAWRAA